MTLSELAQKILEQLEFTGIPDPIDVGRLCEDVIAFEDDSIGIDDDGRDSLYGP